MTHTQNEKIVFPRQSFGVSAQIRSGVVWGGPKVPRGFHQGSTGSTAGGSELEIDADGPGVLTFLSDVELRRWGDQKLRVVHHEFRR